jgi:hypothetical protein
MSTPTIATTAARAAAVLPAGPSRRAGALPPCTGLPEVFQHPLLEEEPAAGSRAAEQRRHAALVAAAAAACGGCPFITACLYRAVTEHDVAGYVAGTTARQRLEIRHRLGVVVPPENLDTLAGVVGAGCVDHDEVLRLRAAHPDESLEVLAGRLGCSLSTVKRHLRRERTAPTAPSTGRPRPRLREVLAAAADVTQDGRSGVRAA